MATIPWSQLSARVPIVLLPVRLETRFDTAASKLRIRIYPDEIFANSHEPALTAREREAGEAFWNALWEADGDRERQIRAWRQLIQRSTVPRAAWIAEALTPTNLGDPTNPPKFPAVSAKEEAWSRPVTAELLPDHWVATGYLGGLPVASAESLPVKKALALTLSPVAGTQRVPLDGSLEIDKDLFWTVDYNTALAAGMALDLPLPPAAVTGGLDRLLVFGLRGEQPDTNARDLKALLEAHRFSRSLALVAQGTPTNNTGASPAGFPPKDLDGSVSFAVEREGLTLEAGCDGERLLRALGLVQTRPVHLAGADRDELTPARAMNRALWPATLGYFIDQMMAPLFETEEVLDVRRYFTENIFGRGRYPAFRIGAVPYGVLPVTSLASFQPESSASAETMTELVLPGFLRGLLPVWKDAIPRVPRVGPSADPEGDLLAILGQEASTREVRVRRGEGPAFIINVCQILDGFLGAILFLAWKGRQEKVSKDTLGLLKKDPDWREGRLLWTSFFQNPTPFGPPLVAPGPLSESLPLPASYVKKIREASIAQLKDAKLLDGPEPNSTPLLYRMLRHAALLEYAWVAWDLLIGNTQNRVAPWERLEREMWSFGVFGPFETRTLWQYLEGPLLLPGGSEPHLGEYLLSDRHQGPTGDEIRVYRESLKALEDLPSAELERLFTETLDVSSHRLDAWVTSLAARRLEKLRKMQTREETHLGAYAWVENLRPAPPRATRTVGGVTAIVPAVRGGYVQAPSMTHAATAAVLRNAHLTHEASSGERYAVHLSSARVRAARQVLDAVKNGQSLGAVLGYQFERGLHERRIEKFIAPARNLCPLVADKGKPRSGEPVEALAARNVVDGLRLRAAWKEGRVFGAPGLSPSAEEKPKLMAELERLDQTIDAVADLLMAESVHQLVRGNLAAGAAGLDALSQGLRPPDPGILETPRSGLSLTHRVGIVLGAEALSPGNGWPVQATPRAQAEPFLDGWVGTLLGDPRQVRCRVSVTNPAREIPVSLADLKVRPLDVLALAEAAGAAAEDSELDRRVAFAALGTTEATGVRILYAPDPAWDRKTIRSFPDLLESARAVSRLIRGARALRPEDLQASEKGTGSAVLAREITGRAETAERALRALDLPGKVAAARADPSRLGELRQELMQAADFGLAGAFPALGAKAAELIAVAETVDAEIKRRPTVLIDPDNAKQGQDKLRSVFGEGFLALPRFKPPDARELDAALATGPQMVLDPKPVAVDKWLQQAARVRPALDRLRLLRLITEALGRPRMSFDIAQLPFKAGERWVALRGLTAESNGRISIVLHRPVQPRAEGGEWAGLFVDEWVETVPEKDQDTALAFHFDNPGAEAPQAVLVAVHPSLSAALWGEVEKAGSILLEILNETLDLAKVRAVDGELLDGLGHVLPPILLADDELKDNTIATSFQGALVSETTVKKT